MTGEPDRGNGRGATVAAYVSYVQSRLPLRVVCQEGTSIRFPIVLS
jgi:hypothetical protein